MFPVAIFLRSPRPGRTKTRLIPALGAERSATLYEAFVHDVIHTVDGIHAARPCLWAACQDDQPWLDKQFDIPSRIQHGRNIGERMRQAIDTHLQSASAVLLIGTDIPTLPRAILRTAIEALNTRDVVLGPCTDGGFFLLGTRLPLPALTQDIRWSTSYALRDTLDAFAECGHSIRLTAPWYDVDRPADLRLLRMHLRLSPTCAPHTARCLQQWDTKDEPEGTRRVAASRL